jgi:protein-tyrosine-phosphatase
VVFVCEHGAAKSVIAAAYFNKLAAEKGLAHRAITRGTNIDPAFGQATVAGLRNDGFAPLEGAPRRVEAADLAGAERLVTFGVEAPAGLPPVKREDWNVPGPSANYAASRDAIKANVEKLVSELAKTGGQ